MVVLPLQQVLPEAAAILREEIASSHLSLEEEIDKFHFEEEETQGAQVVHISDAEDEPDRHSGVHTLILVITCPNSTLEEEEDKMALNRRSKSLRDLMTARNKGSTLKEVLKSQVSPTLPPPTLLLLTNLGLHVVPNLKKKRPVQEIKEGEVAS